MIVAKARAASLPAVRTPRSADVVMLPHFGWPIVTATLLHVRCSVAMG